MAPVNREEAIAAIKAIIAKYCAKATLTYSAAWPVDVYVELGEHHINNDDLVGDLLNIKSTEAVICPCRTMYVSDKRYI